MTIWQHPDWTVSRRRTLEAALERILPLADSPDSLDSEGAAPTDRDSGAVAVAEYVARTILEAHLVAQLPFLLAALDELDELAAGDELDGDDQAAPRCFADLAGDERESLLRRLEGDSNPYLAHAVNLLVQLGLEGFLGDPSRGGNPAGSGWVAVGLTSEGPRRRLRRTEA